MMEKLPVGWESLRLKRGVTLGNYRTDERPESLPYLGLENVESWTGRLVLNDAVIESTDQTSESGCVVNRFEAGDVLFGKLRPYLAKVHLAGGAGVCSTEFLVLKPDTKLDGRFLRYVLLNREFIESVNSSTFGAKMPRADWDFIGSLPIPVPPLLVQQRIAEYLDRETGRLDGLVAAKQRWLVLLAEKRRALITRAVTRGLTPHALLHDSGFPWLGQIPRHWQVPPVYARFEVQLGKMLDEKRITGRYLAPYLRNVDVQWDSINIANLPEMDFSTEDRNQLALCPGDLLVCEGGEVGRTATWRGELKECYYQKALHRLRPLTEKDEPQFFCLFMRFAVELGVFAALGNGSTIDHLPAEKLRLIRYPSPPVAEQKAIVTNITAEMAKLDRLRQATEQTIQLLRERRTALIASSVIGKVAIKA